VRIFGTLVQTSKIIKKKTTSVSKKIIKLHHKINKKFFHSSTPNPQIQKANLEKNLSGYNDFFFFLLKILTTKISLSTPTPIVVSCGTFSFFGAELT
jgi:hypothetical protein